MTSQSERPSASAFGNHVTPPVTGSEFYDHVLLPYDDIDLFRQRYNSTSRTLRRNPELTPIIAEALASGELEPLDNVDDLLAISRELDAPKHETPLTQVIDSLTLQQGIINIANEHGTEEDDHAFAVITLIEKMYQTMADEVPDEKLTEYRQATSFALMQISRLAELSPAGMSHYMWISRRLSVFEAFLIERKRHIEFIKELPGHDIEPITPEQVASDSAAIESLFRDARSQQNYGVKMSYKQEVYRPGSLIFYPMDQVNRLLVTIGEHPVDNPQDVYTKHVTRSNDGVLTYVFESPKKSFHKGIVIKASNQETPDGRPLIDTNVTFRGDMELHENGVLRTHYKADLAEVAARYGKYGSFRALQAEILSNYIDLTNPLAVTNEVARHTAPLPAMKQHQHPDEGLEVVRRLLIPRIKARTEATPEQSDISSESAREVRLHGVVWHIRQLPEGWNASPDAVALAVEAGITLRPGETFVRPHQRGAKHLGEVVAHQLVQR